MRERERDRERLSGRFLGEISHLSTHLTLGWLGSMKLFTHGVGQIYILIYALKVKAVSMAVMLTFMM